MEPSCLVYVEVYHDFNVREERKGRGGMAKSTRARDDSQHLSQQRLQPGQLLGIPASCLSTDLENQS